MENRVAFHTLGCKVNQYETNAMIQLFLENGYKLVEFNEIADIYVVNTCTVTNMSDKKSRQMLRKVKHRNPNSIIIAVGCYAQVAKKELENIEEINIVLGNNEKKDIIKYIDEYNIKRSLTLKEKSDNTLNDSKINSKEIIDFPKVEGKALEILKNRNKISNVSKIENVKDYLEFGQVLHLETTRAVIKIQDGCNNFCTYCIIPYARGRIRSRKKEEILKEIKMIVSLGIKEVVLTGIHIASYGKDLDKLNLDKDLDKVNSYNDLDKINSDKELNKIISYRDDYYLIDLIEDINKIEGLERIRLGSLEPNIITKEFCERLSKVDKICEHFHLSLQSGCDSTLKRMNRKYSTEEFRNCVNLLRETFKTVNLTTDIIVGFPGEIDEEFNKTYKFLKEIKFFKMHVFKYSKRNGTVAATMENQIDETIKEERSKKLIELSDYNEKEYLKQYIGKEIEVLFEEEKDGVWVGHTKNYMSVKIDKKSRNFEKGCYKKDEIVDIKPQNETFEENSLKNLILSVKIENLENLVLVGK